MPQPVELIPITGMMFRKKTDSWLMRTIGKILATGNPDFMKFYFTTIGKTTFVPTIYDKDEDWGTQTWIERHWSIIAHEMDHVQQAEKYSMPLMALMYLGPSPFYIVIALLSLPFLLVGLPFYIPLGFGVAAVAFLPLSIGFAYGRWFLEREAYMTSLRLARKEQRRALIESIVRMLWKDYLMTWPPGWMRKWLIERCTKEAMI